jgi:PAS domain S-box-containing protein
MTRRIIVVEDISDDGQPIENLLEELNDKGYKAYLASSVFATDSTDPADSTPDLSVLKPGDPMAVSTLLAQKTILETELRKYRTLIENSGDMMYAVDFAGNITFISNNVERILGYKADKLLGKNFLTFVPPDAQSAAAQRLAKQMAGGAQGTFTAEFVASDGRRIPVEINGRNYYENNLPVLNVGLIRDITRRRAMEAQVLRRNRELTALYSVASVLNQSLDMNELLETCLDRLLDAVTVETGGILLLDAKGEPTLSAGRNFSDDFGLILDELIGDWNEISRVVRQGDVLFYNDLNTIEGIDPALIARSGYKFVVMGPLQSKDRVLGGFVLAGKQNQTFTQDDRELVLSVGKQVGMALQTAELYSALNQTVEELRKTNDQLAEATRHKSEFLAVMSHELRTPLNAIIGFSELLEDQAFGTLNKKQARYVENIHTSGKHLLALVNDVLDLAKVEAGKMELQLDKISVRELVNEIFMSTGSLAMGKQIALSTPVQQSDVRVLADRGRFKQILYNLVSNAIKFTPDGGHVNVSHRITRQDGFDWLELSVTDNGIGIKPEDQSRIFEEFQMVDSTLSKRQQGTGLGLALSRRLAELHGGTLTVQSEFGAGSTFIFAMPLDLHKAKDNNPDDKEQKEQGKKLALVIEDEDRSAELLQLYMEQSGYEVARCISGADAASLAKELQPDVITLDIILPQKNGWEVLRELKGDPATRDIPVMVVSMVDTNDAGFVLGAVAYFVKPVRRHELLDKLQEIELDALSEKRRKNFDSHRKQGGALQALVIDDSQQDREYLSTVLQSAGIAVVTAASGEEGWRLAQQRPPDLVVLDLMMPDTDGFSVLKKLRQNPATEDVPVFIYTAKELNAAERRELKEAEGVLQKGELTRESLLQAVGYLSPGNN